MKRPTRPGKRFVVAATMAALVAAGVGIGSIAQADDAGATAQDTKLHVVTANVNYGLSPKKVRQDINNYKSEAHVILFQETKNVKLANLFNKKWQVIHNTSSDAKAGSAIAYRKSAVDKQIKHGQTLGVAAPDGVSLLDRWVTWVDVKLKNGSKLRLSSLHLPIKKLPKLQKKMIDNVAPLMKNSKVPMIIGGDWNLKVNSDPHNLGKRTGFNPHGKGPRDGFYTSPRVPFTSIKMLSKGHSDHEPVKMVVTLPS